MADWFARPVLLVADVERAVDFYVNRLGFTQSWRYEEGGKPHVAQVDRRGCALILSSQWPDKVGKGIVFISLDVDAAPDKLRAEETAAGRAPGRARRQGGGCEGRVLGIPALVVRDIDGNELYFPYPSDAASANGKT